MVTQTRLWQIFFQKPNTLSLSRCSPSLAHPFSHSGELSGHRRSTVSLAPVSLSLRRKHSRPHDAKKNETVSLSRSPSLDPVSLTLAKDLQPRKVNIRWVAKDLTQKSPPPGRFSLLNRLVFRIIFIFGWLIFLLLVCRVY
jgi:hypothetical protein